MSRGDYDDDVSPGCDSQLILTLDDLARVLDCRQQVDVAILDFTKAFDSVAHQRVLEKLRYYGVGGQVQQWINAFLSNRTQHIVLGCRSSGASVASEVPQSTVLGPLLFLLFIIDLPEAVQSITICCLLTTVYFTGESVQQKTRKSSKMT